jgi:HTH-type transcriptional regulator/antitoxin HipB
MRDYPIKTVGQLSALLRSFRKERGHSQADLAIQAGAVQQQISNMENNVGTTSVDRLMKVLAALDVELVLRDRKHVATSPTQPDKSPPGRW